jgi:hypothetical protein
VKHMPPTEFLLLVVAVVLNAWRCGADARPFPEERLHAKAGTRRAGANLGPHCL